MTMPLDPLDELRAGDRLVVGGGHLLRVSPELAAAFRAGDRLLFDPSTGTALHVPCDDHDAVRAAVTAAVDAFEALRNCTDEQVSAFFDRFASLLVDDEVVAVIRAANNLDVAEAEQRGRATGRLRLDDPMRVGMVAGLRMWRDSPTRRHAVLDTVEHGGWRVEQRRDPLGVVGFVFEGRPNVFADATGVLRTGNTAVMRIGSDALRTAIAIMDRAIQPALSAAGLPAGAVGLIPRRTHASGWALFADERVALAIARGSGPAVSQLGAVARQHGVPVSLHGTGGAWLVAAPSAPLERFANAVRHSLDRKVCNTLNVCCIVRERAAELLPVFVSAVQAAAAPRGVEPIIHELTADDDRLAREWEWDEVPEVAYVVVDSVDHAVQLCNRFSPHFVASLVSADDAEHESFYRAVDAPFVGDGFTRWVDGQFALGQPELGLSNWQTGRLLGRGGVLSGDSVHTVRLVARVDDDDLHR